MKGIDVTTLFLVVLGALNWGLLGIFSFDLIATVFGSMSVLTRIVYTLIGVAGVYQLSQFKILREKWFHAEAH
ncbi:MAG: DUF378 domain-containing protein [Candidatus Lindowbacteria bacterium]|nr:DUF378 domain-containing protein [Candidatus Lindowbacteria bacterium]